MPDALSKTVPIWIAVLNCLLFPNAHEAHALHTPPRCVSPSEHVQVEHLLPRFCNQLRSLQLDIGEFRRKISKPLRPLWVTQESTLPSHESHFPDFLPVVLCTSSRRVTEGDVAADGYIQGAGDDNEGWSRGLSADVFWQHQLALLNSPEDSLPDLIVRLMAKSEAERSNEVAQETLIRNTTWLYVAADRVLNDASKYTPFEFIIHCSMNSNKAVAACMKSKYLHLTCHAGKAGSRDLRKELDKLQSRPNPATSPKTLVCCPTGTDLSLGVGLALLCLQPAGSAPPQEACNAFHAASREARIGTAQQAGLRDKSVTKDFIRQRLTWITTSCPNAQPSRATLLAVNDFLMSKSAVGGKMET